MNAQSLAILTMAIPNVKTVRVRYEGNQKSYTFLTDLTLKVGEYVTVGAAPAATSDAHGTYPQVVKVLEVHSTPQLDFHNTERQYRWIIGKVDEAAANARAAQIAQIADQLAAVDYIVQQQAALDRYLAILPPTSAAYNMISASKAALQAQLSLTAPVADPSNSY